MKMKLVLLTLALLGMSACGGEGGALTAGGNAQGRIVGNVRQALQDFSVLLTDDVSTNVPSFQFNIPSFVGAYDGCRTYLIGSSSSDKHYKIDFNCRNIVDGSMTINLLGTYEYQVEDTTDISKGYRQVYDMSRENVGGFSDVYKGFDELRRTSSQVIFESDMSVKMKMENHDPPVDWEWRRAYKSVYTPDDMTTATSGTAQIQGHFGVNGRIGGGPNKEDYGVTKFTFEFSSKDLVYDSAGCQYFKSGTITFKDGAGNSLVHTYSCNGVSSKWNGQPFSW